MTRIQNNFPSQMAAALRAHVAASNAASKLLVHDSKQRKTQRTPMSTLPDQTGSTPDLADVLAERIQQVAVDDPHFKRKVFRHFLESVLGAEFGVAIMRDARFAAMVDSVQLQIEADPPLALLMHQAIDAMFSDKSLGVM